MLQLSSARRRGGGGGGGRGGVIHQSLYNFSLSPLSNDLIVFSNTRHLSFWIAILIHSRWVWNSRLEISLLWCTQNNFHGWKSFQKWRQMPTSVGFSNLFLYLKKKNLRLSPLEIGAGLRLKWVRQPSSPPHPPAAIRLQNPWPDDSDWIRKWMLIYRNNEWIWRGKAWRPVEAKTRRTKSFHAEFSSLNKSNKSVRIKIKGKK